jgi:hypothetical protein
MMKSSTLGGTWAEVHTAGRPSTTNAQTPRLDVAAVQISDVLHVVYNIRTGWYYVQFNMATDTWGTPVGVVTGLTAQDWFAMNETAIDIAARSNGDLLVFYSGPGYTNMTTYPRLHLARRVGTTWTTGMDFAAGNTSKEPVFGPKISIDANDLATLTFHWRQNANEFITYTTGNAFGTFATPTGLNYTTGENSPNYVALSSQVRSGTPRVLGFQLVGATTPLMVNFSFNSAQPPPTTVTYGTTSVTAAWRQNASNISSHPPWLTLNADSNGVQHLVFIDTNGDVRRATSNAFGDTWTDQGVFYNSAGTTSTTTDGTAVRGLSSNIIGSGSDEITLAIAFNDNGTNYVDSYQIQASQGPSPVTGTLAATETGADTAVITGTVVPPAVTGTLAATEAAIDTATITGTVANPVSGSLAATETGADVLTATGQVVVSGALAATETGADTAAITGTVVPAVTGSLAATETGADTFTATGQVVVSGSLVATETGADTAAILGTITLQGTLAATETGADTAVITGTVAAPITGSLAATEVGADTAAIAGQIGVQGALTATETGSDTATIIGQVVVSGSLAATETGTDTAALAGTVTVSGSLAATETGVDVVTITGEIQAPPVTGSLAAAETGDDTAAIVGQVQVSGALTATETGADTAVIVGQVVVSGSLAATETGTDTFAATGQITVSGSLAATETGVDTASIIGEGVSAITGTLAATETGETTWSVSFDETLDSDSSGFGDYTIRQVVLASDIAISGSAVRLRIVAPATGGMVIGSCYIGHKAAGGDVWDFESTPTQVTFNGGSAGLTLAAGAASVFSDEIAFALDETKDLIVSFYFSSTTTIRRSTVGTTASYYYKATSDAATVNASGYTSAGSNTHAVFDLIEVGVPGSALDTATILGQVGVSGALAATETGEDTAAIAGLVTYPVTGTLAATEDSWDPNEPWDPGEPWVGGDTAAITGTVDLTLTGTLAATEGVLDTAAIVGAVGITGSLATTEGYWDLSEPWDPEEPWPQGDTAAITGVVSAPGVSGLLAAVEAGTDVAAITGTIAVQGTLAATEAAIDVVSITGTVTGAGVTGTLIATEAGPDVAVITGIVVPPVSGTLVAIETGTDVVAIGGTVTQAVTGTLAATEVGADTAAVTGTVSLPPVTGALEAREDGWVPSEPWDPNEPWYVRDTAAITGVVSSTAPIVGALAATEGAPDTAVITGTVPYVEPERLPDKDHRARRDGGITWVHAQAIAERIRREKEREESKNYQKPPPVEEDDPLPLAALPLPAIPPEVMVVPRQMAINISAPQVARPVDYITDDEIAMLLSATI